MSKAATTRLAILQKAFELIYTKGYQTTSIDDILATTNVTKGAFYYHFKNKDEMGLAVINEVMLPTMYDAFVLPFQSSTDPLNEIYKTIKTLLLDSPFLDVKYGCPAGNMVQEMSPWNQEFSDSLSKLTGAWEQAIIAGINRAKKAGTVRKNVQGKQVAIFIMAGYWGIRSFGKLYGNTCCYTVYLKELQQYLKSLE